MDTLVPQFIDTVKDSVYALSSCLCQPSANLKLNGRSYKIIKLLGEGGFSYVYLVEDVSSGRKFALKKIRCPAGTDNAQQAMKELEAYKKFRHPNCIRCFDSCVTQEADTKIIYLFLPFYKRGNLQDVISANAVNGSRYSEKELLSLFLKTCEAVRSMHNYVPGPSATYPPTASPTIDGIATHSNISRTSTTNDNENGGGDDDYDEQSTANIPLISNERQHDELSVTPTNSNHAGGGSTTPRQGEIQPFAHRDIKPANIMISDDGTQPILMDFGSAGPARINVTNRSIALAQQDEAAEHSTMPYRAPELFDVKTDSVLDEKVDVWSLGCTLFAVAYGHSPFEGPQDQQGGSIMLAVTSGRFRFPRNDEYYSQSFKDLISSILIVEPNDRPDINKVIELTKDALQQIS